MGLFDRLVKKATDKMLSGSKPSTNNSSNDSKFIEDFMKHGSISSDSLPQTRNSYYYAIDANPDVITIVEHVPRAFDYKNKLVRTFPTEDVVAFRATNVKKTDLSTAVLASYESEIICASGERYSLHQSLWTRSSDSRLTIREEIEANAGLDMIILSFLGLIEDDYTKQWVNGIYADRGAGIVFDEDGNIDVEAFLKMQAKWRESKSQEWDERLKHVQI